MKRSLKNGIMVGIIILMCVGVYFTINMNNNSVNDFGPGSNVPSDFEKGEPPERPDSNSDMFDGENPPARPDESTDDFGKNNNAPPEKPNSENSNILFYVLLGTEILVITTTLVYLVMSNFNKKTFKETYENKSKLILSGLIVILLTGGLTYFGSKYAKKDNNDSPRDMPSGSSSSVTYSANTEITKDEDITSGSYESTTKDENVISVSGEIKSTLSGITVNKTGDSDGGDNTSFYGTNSAIIAKEGANVTISNAIVTTDATGANGVFSYGGSATTNNSSSDNTTVNISDSTITTNKDNSGGIMTTGGGIMNATNLTITTAGTSSAAIRSDRGGGIVTVTEGTYKTTGKGSPTIYSTADITVTNATLIATASEGIVIEGKNSVTLENVELTDTNNTLNGQSTTYKNIFLYQSMSGDAANGKAVFTSKNSTITTNKGDSFYVTNTTAEINLENNTIVNNDSSGYFLRIQKDSWGNSDSNGGIVTLNMTNQKVIGDIYVDNISTLTMNINESSFEGVINNDNLAKSITLKLDKASSIKLTGDSYITSLEDEDNSYSNIDFNGYKLYVNGNAIN